MFGQGLDVGAVASLRFWVRLAVPTNVPMARLLLGKVDEGIHPNLDRKFDGRGPWFVIFASSGPAPPASRGRIGRWRVGRIGRFGSGRHGLAPDLHGEFNKTT